ncbi:MAG: HAMP domain-containing sensor histidine kinase [bacterium]
MLSVKLTKIFSSIRFKLTLIYSGLMFIFISSFVLVVNLYLNQYFKAEPNYLRNNSNQIINEEMMPGQISPQMMFNEEQRQKIRDIRRQDLHNIQLASVYALIPVFITSFVLGYYISGQFLAPLGILQKKIALLNDADLGVELEVFSEDEIGELISSFNKMSLRLKKAFDAQAEFLQNASHELKTPLTIIQANLDGILDDQTASQAEMHASVAKALEGVKRVNQLTEYFLDLTRTEALPKRQIDLKIVINEVVDSLTDLSKSSSHRLVSLWLKKVKLQTDLPEKAIFYQIESVSFGRAIANLIENAIKYSHQVKSPIIEVKLTATEQQITIVVSDNGPGIPEREQSKIFERFYRIDHSRSRDTGGFGLGLAITQKIIAEHQGQLTLQSKPGKTEFKIILPAI